ncbi:hypothetical protein, partial [Nocardia farcinica]|uniref:hypothetical protein n=1 Tax=Nocardia farcinica TaxID=37329 RepID=UPI002454BB15
GRGATVEFDLSADLTAAVADLARAHNVSSFMVLHAAYAALLARLASTSPPPPRRAAAGGGGHAPS